MNRCEQLAALEQEAGFRSSFNFIPEGEYRVSDSLRQELVRRGFEIGVHDLKHDGKLYLSKERFQRSAIKINSYLKDWNAVGFRSGFMHHNLDWIRSLDVLYDASTFDTDPFEPQPEGTGTIFPFWIAGSNGRPGYVELPYTLVQDITLFVLLRERSITLWKQKVDWLADNGGMALVNVHPDYVSFGDKPSPKEFPAPLYRELLDYVNEKYADTCWRPLPKELAAFVAQNRMSVSELAV